jgi:hypothetical protein
MGHDMSLTAHLVPFAPVRRANARPLPVTFAALLGVVLAAGVGRADFHVAPNGSNTNASTEQKPLGTLEAARDAVRRLKATRGLPAGGVTVWLHGGDYVRTNTLELTAADSGTPEAPVIWRAHPTARPRLLGGRLLGGFRAVNDPAILDRLEGAAREKVVQTDLRALGITEFGELTSRGFGRPTSPAHAELFFDGRPMPLARWPDEGSFTQIAGLPAGAAQGDDHGGSIGRLTAGFTYAGDRPRRWRNLKDLWVHGYWAYDWANSYERVATLDREQRLVTTAPPHGLYGFRQGQRFYFVNVLEELDQPGEWFLERETATLYFWPPEPVAGHEVLLSLLAAPLLTLNDVSHVTIRGLALEAPRGHAIELRGGASNRVAGCLIRNVGNWGVRVSGGTGHGVIGCDLFDTGDGGVELLGGDRPTLTPAGHFVENCHFQRQGRWSKCYVPAVHLVGVGLRASHNLIHDHPHCAILFGGNDHLIEFNEIHHIALETGDVGAIYTGRDYTYRGNRIRHNFIHRTGGVGMGSMGVYMDDCVSGTEVFGNVFYQVHWAMFIGGGRDHRVENNVFVDCDPAVRMDGRGLDRAPVWRNMVDDTMRRRLADLPATLYRRRYPELATLDAHYGPPGGPEIRGESFRGVPPEGNLVARNVCVGRWLEVGWHATEAMLRVENNLTNAAASLARPAAERVTATDFALTPDSPAWSLGFQRIPLEQIGLRDDEYRRELAQRTPPQP